MRLDLLTLLELCAEAAIVCAAVAVLKGLG
jgi:hypothetical protein